MREGKEESATDHDKKRSVDRGQSLPQGEGPPTRQSHSDCQPSTRDDGGCQMSTPGSPCHDGQTAMHHKRGKLRRRGKQYHIQISTQNETSQNSVMKYCARTKKRIQDEEREKKRKKSL
jgi:hypothetical protein